MVGAYLFRITKAVRRKPLAAVIVILSIISAITAVYRMEEIPWRLNARNDDVVLGTLSLVLIICFDYAYAVGFRSGVLGVSMPDVTFHFAGPFTKRFNLLMTFAFGLGSAFFFLWLVVVNSPLLCLWIDFSATDMVALIIEAAFTMFLIFIITSYLSARFCDSVPGRVISVIVLIALNLIAGIGMIAELIAEYGSFDIARSQTSTVIVGKIGNSVWADAFPIAGWIGLIYKGIIRHNNSAVIPVCIAYILIFVVMVVIYRKTEFDFYERALDNAQKISDIIEASKAGVEAVNTGIARTAAVGKEVYKRGWGANAFFHMHLFENIRTSKLFFINKVALVYRAFALILLLIMDGFLPEELDILVVIAGVATMMVLNAIVFGGGKTVMEFNRPYLFIIPEKSIAKLAACILADIPEMAFDTLICALIIKLVAWREFSALPIFSFILMMISFDLLSETTGIVCVRLFRRLGKYTLMAIRYIAILVLIVLGMIPAGIITNIMAPVIADKMDIVLSVLISFMGLCYVAVWLIMITLSRSIIDKVDA